MSVFLLSMAEGPTDVYQITTMTVRYEIVVTNSGPGDAEAIPLTAAFVRDVAPNQRVIESKVSPAPTRTYNDSLNNSFALFTVERLHAGQNFTATFTATVELKGMDFNLKPGSGGTYQGEEDAYLAPTSLTDAAAPVVKAKARELEDQGGDVFQTVWNIYNFIVDQLAYQQLPGEWSASWVLTHGEGGSADLANVFVALARASGIPARRLSGWGETAFNVSETRTSNRLAHGWAEFYLPAFGWIPVDPTFGKTNRFDNLGRPDEKHVVMTRGEGIHFFERGAYGSPGGDASVTTDYRVTPLAITNVTVSPEHLIVLAFMYGLPLLFMAVVAHKVWNQRREAGRAGKDDVEGG
jgi:hypothetical protein